MNNFKQTAGTISSGFMFSTKEERKPHLVKLDTTQGTVQKIMEGKEGLVPVVDITFGNIEFLPENQEVYT